eukprot:CAMPEP_0205828622 /NCGR_PEP_ID=MMETSP0206-20130828/35705_1 /ASSEMBLY_ACC=CAM_ASM_000279 /TAXON_ID=36767 /ORGANISM="Euplotes focardii, Strain TN1" /LENGTH=232 /DNA_ID=CAMNT_0053130629 /DNA_START=290 /DNA_END=989 /DNA_ORIENTATION=-
MTAIPGRMFGYATMPIKGRRAKSSYAIARKSKKKRKRLMTAGHGGRKRSAVSRGPQHTRPITAKGPLMGMRNKSDQAEEEEKTKNVVRPDTVACTNMGPLGATEPQDGDEKINQEITREVTGESERDIEARIGNEGEISKESDHEEVEPRRDVFNEKKNKIDNLTDDLSNHNDKPNVGDNEDDENNSPAVDEKENSPKNIVQKEEPSDNIFPVADINNNPSDLNEGNKSNSN